MPIFYALGAILILQGLFSLIEGVRLLRFARRSLGAPFASFTPKAVIIVPCKGPEAGLEANLSALFEQDYPDYEIVFAIASGEDHARGVIERVIRENPGVDSKLVIARPAEGHSEKIGNLLAALDSASATVLVFTDSDARAGKDWLRALVSPLADESTGAATGYRWYLPERGGFFSALLSAWNGSVATTLGDHSRNFAWGGATAILRETFERLNIREAWRKAASDDYALTRSIRSSGLGVAFVPRCLMVSREDMNLSALAEFTTRQVIITRVYRPELWWVGLISNSLFCAFFFGGLAYILVEALGGRSNPLAVTMIVAAYLLGSAKGYLRLATARLALTHARDELNDLWWFYCLLWPAVSLLFLYNFLKSATTRRITWRGVRYELISPVETRVIR